MKSRWSGFHQPHTDHIKHRLTAPRCAPGRVRQALSEALSRYYKLESEAEKEPRRKAANRMVRRREAPRPRGNTGQRGCREGERKKGKTRKGRDIGGQEEAQLTRKRQNA